MATDDATASQPSYKLQLKGDGLSIEQDVSQQVAVAVINVVLGGGVPLATGPTSAAGAVPTAGGTPSLAQEADERLTIGEYIESVGARNNPAKIVAIGRYLRDHRDQQDFSRDDLRLLFREAHETMPGNLARDVATTLSQRWIAEEAGRKGRYYVTKTGNEALDGGFTTKPRSRTPRRRTTKPAAGDEANGD